MLVGRAREVGPRPTNSVLAAELTDCTEQANDRGMAEAKREKFRRRMSYNDLVDWLRIRGLGEGDRQKIKGRPGCRLAGYCFRIQQQSTLLSLIELSREWVHWGVFPTIG